MEGDRAPIAELAALAQAHDAWLMTDDAHGLGICAAHEADVQMGTLSKAAGSYGGYVCARSEVDRFLENKARSLLFATGLPPASVAAASAALAIMKDDAGTRAKAARERPAIHSRARARAGAKPDRAGDRRRGRDGAGGLGHAGSDMATSSSRSARRPCRRARPGCGLRFRRCIRRTTSSMPPHY